MANTPRLNAAGTRCKITATATSNENDDSPVAAAAPIAIPSGSRMHRQTHRKHGRRRRVVHMCVPVAFDVIVMFFVDRVTDAKSFEKQHDHETKQDCESQEPRVSYTNAWSSPAS